LTSPTFPSSRPPPPTRIRYTAAPCTTRLLVPERVAAGPIAARCRGTRSSGLNPASCARSGTTNPFASARAMASASVTFARCIVAAFLLGGSITNATTVVLDSEHPPLLHGRRFGEVQFRAELPLEAPRTREMIPRIYLVSGAELPQRGLGGRPVGITNCSGLRPFCPRKMRRFCLPPSKLDLLTC